MVAAQEVRAAHQRTAKLLQFGLGMRILTLRQQRKQQKFTKELIRM